MADDFPLLLLEWSREIQALSQTGLTFSQTDYDVERYRRLSQLAAAMAAEASTLDHGVLEKIFLAQPGYATPKVDVRGAVIDDGKILLVQERMDERWCMPGGWADVGETPAEMVVREVWEESGFHVRPTKVIAVFDANRGGRPIEFFHAYKIIFACAITGGAARTSNETMALDFFSFDDLPPLSTARTNEAHLAEVRAHVADKNRPAAFD